MNNEPMTRRTFRTARIFGICQSLFVSNFFSPLRHGFVDAFTITKKCSFLFTPQWSPIEHLCSLHQLPSLFGMLQGSEVTSCHSSSRRALGEVAVWPGQWPPSVGSRRLGWCITLTSLCQAPNCHLPCSRVMIALSREIKTSLWKSAASYLSNDLEKFAVLTCVFLRRMPFLGIKQLNLKLPDLKPPMKEAVDKS